MIPYKQLTLAEVFEDCQNKFDNDKYQFLSLLDQTINLDEIVPVSFVTHFHASTGRPRKHPLYPMIKALLIQRIFSIPTDTLLIIFLKYSQELRDFCGFRVVPDASKFTRFKQDFLMDLQSMFDHLVDITEPICQRIDSNLASMSIFDTSGIEACPATAPYKIPIIPLIRELPTPITRLMPAPYQTRVKLSLPNSSVPKK